MDQSKQDVPKESPGGSEFVRYDAPKPREFDLAFGHEQLIDAVQDHLGKVFPGVEFSVFHEMLSDLIHLDVFLVPPNDVVDGWVAMTCGMASRPVSPPNDDERLKYAELMTVLPPDWPLFEDGDMTKDPPIEVYWPIRYLKFLARFPHEFNSWFWYGHTIPLEHFA